MEGDKKHLAFYARLMNIKGEQNIFEPEKKKTLNSKTLLLIGIVAVFLIIMVIAVVMTTNKEVPVRAAVNGTWRNELLNYMIVEDGTIYFPIKKVAPYFGYKTYNGYSYYKSEDTNKCYVENDDEYVNITLYSNQIVKYLKSSSKSECETMELNNVIKAKEGVLYCSEDGIEKIFNTRYYYNEVKKIHTFETLPTKYARINKKLTANANLKINEVSKLYANQKALIDDFAIVKSSNSSYMGVYNIVDEDAPQAIIETKYDKVTYIQALKAFYVESDGKVGVLDSKGNTIISLDYDEIRLIDNKLELFCVKKNGKYGIMKDNSNIKLYCEYDTIGADTLQFEEDTVLNRYFLVNNLIPVKRDGYWGLANKYGDIIADCKYEQLGCIPSSGQYKRNLLYIPSYNVLVAKRDGRYTLLNSGAEEIIPPGIEECYIYTKDGETKYKMVVSSKEYDIIDYLQQKSGISINDSSSNTTLDEAIEEVQNSDEENSNDNNNDNDKYTFKIDE